MDDYEWRPFLYSDTAAGAVNGEWVFGTSSAPLAGNLIYKIDSVRLVLGTTTDTAGNRRLQILFQDSDEDLIAEATAGVNHAAGDSAADAGVRTRKYNFYIGAENKTSFVDTDLLTRTLPDIILPNHWSMKVLDCDSIASDSDKLEIFILGKVAGFRGVTT
jgi:hypothetical protein